MGRGVDRGASHGSKGRRRGRGGFRGFELAGRGRPRRDDGAAGDDEFHGLVSRYFLTAYFGRATERIINNIPGVGTVYRTVKQIVDTFSAQKRNIFEKVVMVEYPAPGTFVIGFLTNRAKGEVQARTGEELWTVFIPTTPTPTSGFLLFYPQHKVQELDMSVGEAMKLIISGGTVVPPWPPTPRQLEAPETSAPPSPPL